jgi:hypothetical protein
MSLAARRQFLATRSIVEVAIRPLKLLTAQANLPCGEPSKATPRGMFWLQPSRGGLARMFTWVLAEMADRDLVGRRPERVVRLTE